MLHCPAKPNHWVAQVHHTVFYWPVVQAVRRAVVQDCTGTDSEVTGRNVKIHRVCIHWLLLQDCRAEQVRNAVLRDGLGDVEGMLMGMLMGMPILLGNESPVCAHDSYQGIPGVGAHRPVLLIRMFCARVLKIESALRGSLPFLSSA